MQALSVKGDAYEIGLAHGQYAKEHIAHNLKVYFYRFNVEWGLSKDEVLRRAELYLDAIEKGSPKYATAMEGLSDGSGQSLVEIAAIKDP